MIRLVILLTIIIGFNVNSKAGVEDSVGTRKIDGVTHVRYLVSPGETIYGISTKYHVPVSRLMEINPELENGLKTGQIIDIPYRPGVMSKKNKDEPEEEEENNEIQKKAEKTHKNALINQVKEKGKIVHVVEKGETLFGLSKKYDVPMHKLMRMNGMELKVGQKLVVGYTNDSSSQDKNNTSDTRNKKSKKNNKVSNEKKANEDKKMTRKENGLVSSSDEQDSESDKEKDDKNKKKENEYFKNPDKSVFGKNSKSKKSKNKTENEVKKSEDENKKKSKSTDKKEEKKDVAKNRKEKQKKNANNDITNKKDKVLAKNIDENKKKPSSSKKDKNKDKQEVVVVEKNNKETKSKFGNPVPIDYENEKPHVLVVPFDPYLYFSDADAEIAKVSGLKRPEVRKGFRRRLNALLEPDGYETVHLLGGKAEDSITELNKIYSSVNYNYEKVLKQEDHLKKEQKKETEKGELTTSVKDWVSKTKENLTNPQTTKENPKKGKPSNNPGKYFAVQINNPDFFTYFNNKYKVDYYLFINQFEVKTNYEHCLDRAAQNYRRTFITHYSIFNKHGKQIAGNRIDTPYHSNENDIQKILSDNMKKIAERIMADLPAP